MKILFKILQEFYFEIWVKVMTPKEFLQHIGEIS